MGILRDWMVGKDFSKLTYRVTRIPYRHNPKTPWQYHVQYFERGKWETLCHTTGRGGTHDDIFWSKGEAEERIRQLKRPETEEVV